jgi:OmpA-OmpF porin, OOP family
MKTPIGLFAGLLLAGAVQAQSLTYTPGPYLLVGGGGSSYETDCGGFDRCDDSGNALKAIAGYRLGGGLSVEAVVLDFGKTTAALGSSSADIEVRAAGGGAAFAADLAPNLRAVVRLGIASVRAKGTGSLGGVPVFSESDSSTELYSGIGFSFAFTRNLALEFAWDSTRGDINGDGGRVSAFTAALMFSF